MPQSRKTHIQRYTNADASFWVEVEIIDELVIESGEGVSYQKTIMTLDENSSTRVKSSKRITNPADDSIYVDVPINENVTVKSGSGVSYQERVYAFVNDESNDVRTARVDRVHSSADLDKTIDAEVIKTFAVKSGEARSYQKRIFALDNSDLPGIRETVRP